MRSSPRLTAPNRRPRQGWAQAFAASLPVDEEMFLEPFGPNAFDAEEWQWDERPTQPESKPKTENRKPKTEN